ncbi:MAG: HesA/MoeB/ThiF family protein [Anaerovoracaceae bacterium]|jgi:molybdopterin/thiamine biosynthesis adenylyltransferase
MTVKERYIRNIGTLTEEENARLQSSNVCVIGCGGLGGNIISNLARLGVGRLTIVDDGTYEPSNLNRQLFSSEKTMDRVKTEVVKERLAEINSDVEVKAVNDRLVPANAADIVRGHDIVIDGLDNLETRLVLEDACAECGIPLVHGGIESWYGQVAFVKPGSRTLHKLFGEDPAKDIKMKTSNPPFTPAIVAGLEVAEAVKYLTGKKVALSGKVLFIDLLDHSYKVLNFD